MSKALELSKKYRTVLNNAGINTPLRQAHFFAQLDAESGLKPQRENLNYSAAALWRYFKNHFKDRAECDEFARKPEKIANRVYSDRMGNGNECSGDGWKYRGGGFIQTTGLRNYTKLTVATGVDYVTHPEKLLNEADAMVAAIFYWAQTKLNEWADLDDIDAISDIINIGRRTNTYGDANGFKHRYELLIKYKSVFKV